MILPLLISLFLPSKKDQSIVMKKLLVLFCLGFSIGAFAQNKDIVFNTTKHNFGKIKHNVPATYTFTYTNNSAKPAVIEVATAECGCTTPVYKQEALPKGKSSTIKVTYNATSTGAFSKKVTVKFVNMPEPYILTIEGDVLQTQAAAPAAKAPAAKTPVKGK